MGPYQLQLHRIEELLGLDEDHSTKLLAEIWSEPNCVSCGPATFCLVASMTAGSRGKLSTRPAGSKPMDSGLRDVLKLATYHSKMVAVTKMTEDSENVITCYYNLSIPYLYDLGS